jgi:hypothetical protein
MPWGGRNERVASPLSSRFAVPNTVDPEEKVMMPVGKFATAPWTSAMNVTGCPPATKVEEVVKVVIVGTSVTFWLNNKEVAVLLLASPE